MAIVFRYKRFSELMHPEFTTNKQYTDAINKLKNSGKKDEANKLTQERNHRFNRDGSPKTPSPSEPKSVPSTPKPGRVYSEEEWKKFEENLRKTIQSDATKKELDEVAKKAADEARGWKGLSTKNKALIGAGSVAALGAAGLIGHGLTRRQRD